jgi:hypothetical protein
MLDSRQGQGFLLCHSVQTGYGAHSASYTEGTRVLSQGVKRPGREADHSLPSSAEGSYTSTPPIRLRGVVFS